jgi:hypothetical protein
MAATGPLEHIWSVGHIYRDGSTAPRSIIVVIGMWLLLGPLLTVLTVGLISSTIFLVRETIAGNSTLSLRLQFLLYFVLIGGGSLTIGKLLFRTTKRYFECRKAGRQ